MKPVCGDPVTDDLFCVRCSNLDRPTKIFKGGTCLFRNCCKLIVYSFCRFFILILLHVISLSSSVPFIGYIFFISPAKRDEKPHGENCGTLAG
jgi:hypothetical protein